MFANSLQTAYLFPGQGSQAVGMGVRLAETYPSATEIYRQADQILGWEISRLSWEGPAERLNDTIHTQPALLVHSVAVLQVMRDLNPGFQPAFVAGHSMGELSALVAAEALPYPDALLLASRRGELMKEAGERDPGGMAAVLGLDIPTLEALCAQASAGQEVVQVANDNCPGQCVISGASPALDRASVLAKEAGARRVVPLAVSIAAHSPLMAQAQEAFSEAVSAAPIVDPRVPIIGNVNARPLRSAEEIRGDLIAQLVSRVRWTESIEWMRDQGVITVIEIGSGDVLTGLARRIDSSLTRYAIGNPEDLEN